MSAETPIASFIPKSFREAVAQRMTGAPVQGYANPFRVERLDANCISQEEPRAAHLDRYPIIYGVIQSPGNAVSVLHHNDLATTMATAWNDRQSEHYLSRDERLIGSIAINMYDPDADVTEIRRCTADRRFRQVLTCSAQDRLLGHRCYFPTYEACVEAGVVFALHPGREGARTLPTPHGTHAPGDVGEFRPALAGRILVCPWHGWEFDIVSGQGAPRCPWSRGRLPRRNRRRRHSRGRHLAGPHRA